ncbi:major facilitator superfamily domain-containing protein [Lipomyces oligophaga]|uniref:major facilitator superfamily domain-containing protein n=1 Tax=Lipomyces oligophaga TaxID=45792 RepID=UPI0034CEA53C
MELKDIENGDMVESSSSSMMPVTASSTTSLDEHTHDEKRGVPISPQKSPLFPQLPNDIPDIGDDPENEEEESDKFIVDFEGPDDPLCPLNWSFKKRAFTTFMFACCTFGPQFNSSIYGPSTSDIAEIYHVSHEVATLGSSLYLLGIGFGPMLFAPVSEGLGRKIGCVVPFFFSGFFSIGCGAANNLQTVIIMRFFEGLLGGAPVSNSGGVLGDIWRPEVRGTALVCYAFVVAAATTLAPVVGAALDVSVSNGWRWGQYICAIYTFVVSIAISIFVDETYHPVVLSKKAKKLRLETRNWAYHSHHDEWDFSLKAIVTKHLLRPFQLLLTPIVTCMCFYGAYAFGLLYFGVIAVPFEFFKIRGWTLLPAYLPSFGVFTGIYIGGVINIIGGAHYKKKMKAAGGKPVPEERLFIMRVAVFFIPIGLFILGWTSDPKYPFMAPIVGLALMSCGFFCVFQGCLNYLVDTFTVYAASAIAAATFTRSCMAAGFPLFATIMFDNLGVDWGCSLIGFIALLGIPIPYVLYRYGPTIRQRNPYAIKATAVVALNAK